MVTLGVAASQQSGLNRTTYAPLRPTVAADKLKQILAREKAAKVAKERGQYELASRIEAFQFRDLRAKAGTKRPCKNR